MLDADESALLDSEMGQINALVDVFERASRAGASPRIEDYLTRFAEHIRPIALRELLRVDVELRLGRGESIDAGDYHERFPNLAETFLASLQPSDVVLATAAARETGNSTSQTEKHARQGAKRASGQLQIRCPNCHSPTEVAVNTALTDITCDACGSQFSLVGRSDDTQVASPLSKLGRFDLIERLGIGAFGSVWKARDKELDRTVAVKIPRRGGMSPDEQEQFFREARAAAQLRHPSIVSVHEVGRDGDSIYIVSDFVRGVTLRDWLTGQPLTSREAAELCAKLADALDHAHEQGVVHRDLKPANIMMDYDGQPHLMDFGLARREAGEVTMTADGQVMGTPAYMSPEQAQGDSHQADRRSDVYSLGVVLFQLLTGELPFRGNVRMLIKQVIHDEPPSPRKLNGSIPKDLETITLKCLEKEPPRRYQSARDMADECRRYLAGMPIQARPINRVARAWRWAKRKPAAAAFLMSIVLAAIGFAAAFVRERDLRQEVVKQKNEADSERAGAEAVVSFLTQDVLAKASPEEMSDKAVRDTLVKTLIEPAAATVAERFHDKPLIEAKVRATLASTFFSLGRFDLAAEHAQAALALRRKILGDDNPATITALNDYAAALQQLGKVKEAAPLYEQALDQSRKLLGEKHPDTLTKLSNYANALDALGQSRKAEPLYKDVLEQRREVLGKEHPDTILSLSKYATTLESLGRPKDAEPLHKQALDQSRAVLGEDHPDTLRALNNYAAVLNAIGRPKEAEPLYKQALEQRRKVLGEDHPSTIAALNNYAIALLSLGRAGEAEPFFREAVEKYRKVLGENHPTTILSMNNYAGVLGSLGRSKEAEPLYKESLAQFRKRLGDNHPETLRTMNNYALILESLGRKDEAEPLYKEALERRRKVLGENHPDTVATRKMHARVLKALGRQDDAISGRENTAK